MSAIETKPGPARAGGFVKPVVGALGAVLLVLAAIDPSPTFLLLGGVLLAVGLSRWMGWLLAAGAAVLVLWVVAGLAGGAPNALLLIVGVLLLVGGAIVRAINRRP